MVCHSSATTAQIYRPITHLSGVLSAGDVAAPDLVDVDTIAVLRKRWLAKTLSAPRFASALDDLEDLTIDRYPTSRFMRRAYGLRDNLTPYDAAYVALAETLGCGLLTADRRLSKATGPRCPVRLLR
jgi:predicted nucleic acid-binding protein